MIPSGNNAQTAPLAVKLKETEDKIFFVNPEHPEAS
jgi:hypothetical protein